MGVGTVGSGFTRYVCDFLRGNEEVCPACECVHEYMEVNTKCSIYEASRKSDGALSAMLEQFKLNAGNGLSTHSLTNKAWHPLGCPQPIISPKLFEDSQYRVQQAESVQEEREPEAVQVGFDFGEL